MCGIAGVYYLNDQKVKLPELRKFTDAIQHRGPDGSGYELLNDEKIGFGHRRLSILDLSERGKQPMHFRDRYCITFNGEIFNFLELREELIHKGYEFHTETDTEVVLSSFHAWGKDAFKRFNGMWALAIWDSQDKKVLLSRDRFGVKPLHFIYQPNRLFAFASETLAFGFLDGFKKEADDDHLLFAIQNPSALEPTGKTIYKNIEQVLPGHFIEIGSDTSFVQKRWWNTFDNLVKVPESAEERTLEFFELFKNACKIRLRSDVSIASALSGGLDSSSVFAMVQHLSKTDQSYNRVPEDWTKAVVATFPGTEVDEKKFADKVVDFFKAQAIYTTPDYSSLADNIVSTTRLFDSISATPIVSVTGVYKAMKENGITVSLDGHGGDELLYGYKSTVYDLFNYYCSLQKFDEAEKIVEVYSFMGNEEAAANVRKTMMNNIAQLKNRSSIAKLKDKIFLQNRTVNVLGGQKEFTSDKWISKDHIKNFLPTDFFKRINTRFNIPESLAVKDFFIDHIPYNLRDFDRAAMQNGVEIRMPLMDYRLVNYSFSLPLSDKVGKGYTKLILRNAMKGLLPEEIRMRRNKIGLGAPIVHWFNNQLSEFICDQVASQSFLQTKYWDGKQIKEFVERTTSEKKWDIGSANRFWNILNAHIVLNAGNS